MSELTKENTTLHFKEMARKGWLLKEKDNSLVYDADTGAPMDFAIENQPIGEYAISKVNHWTHICMDCIIKFNVNINQTDIITVANSPEGPSRANPPCGAEWCENTSTHFYDFRGENDPFVAAVLRTKHENSRPPSPKDG